MESTIRYGSVCSGIEAATVAWHPLGWKADWLAEIEPFPSAVLAHHYPDTPNLGDMTKLAPMVLTGRIAAPDVLVGGTPCQAFSVAGLREGLSDPRGALTIKYVELADAIDFVRTRRGDDECVIAWENVPGVLSDKENAFGCFLGALAGEDCELRPAGERWTDAGCVYGPKRAIAWRVLDAQYFGLAQRRRRVFLVASARKGFDPSSVLFEREGLRRDLEPWTEYPAAMHSDEAAQIAFDMLGFGQYGTGRTASTLKARDYKDFTDLVLDEEGRVRGITITERESLQGFDKDWTRVPFDGKPADECPLAHRIKAVGNSKAVPVVRWVGGRINVALGGDHEHP